MRRLRRVLIGVSALALTGCAYSLNPLYTDDDLVSEPAIVGEWHGVDRFYGSESDANTSATYTFENADKRGSYKLTYADRDGVIRVFHAHLIRLQERLFLDVERLGGHRPNDLLLPVHALFRIEVLPSVLVVRMLDYSKTAKFLKDKPDAIRHAQEEDLILLTEDTLHLQTFLATHDEQLFSDHPYAVLSKELASKLSVEFAWAGLGTTVLPHDCPPQMPSNKPCRQEGFRWTYEVMDRVPADVLSFYKVLTVAFVLKGPPAGIPVDLYSSWSFRPHRPDKALSGQRGSGSGLALECTVGELCYAKSHGITGPLGAGVMHVEVSWRGQALLEKDIELYEEEQERR